MVELSFPGGPIEPSSVNLVLYDGTWRVPGYGARRWGASPGAINEIDAPPGGSFFGPGTLVVGGQFDKIGVPSGGDPLTSPMASAHVTPFVYSDTILLFEDDLESGDMSMWSASVP
jgi:hypothetical protein